jgi:hypothetical protein
MSLFAFTAAHPLKAAAELREAGYEAFALMMPDRRRLHRHRAKGPSSFERKPVVALQGYVFAADPDPWAVHTMRHVRQAVKFCGHWQAIPEREAAWLLNPPKPMFHDTAIPRFLNRPAPPLVKAGDRVRFTLACEEHERPVMCVDGDLLLMEIRMLGRDVKVRVPVSMVEVAA